MSRIDPFGLADITINGRNWENITSPGQFDEILSLYASNFFAEKIQTLTYDGHFTPDEGAMAFGEKRQDTVNDADILDPADLALLLLKNINAFADDARVDLKGCGSANGSTSAAFVFHKILPKARVWGVTGYYLPFVGPVNQRWWVTQKEGGYNPKIPYESNYIQVK